MSDAINTLAVQFAAQNREDQRALRDELRGLRHILSAIVVQQGESTGSAIGPGCSPGRMTSWRLCWTWIIAVCGSGGLPSL